MGRTLKLSLSLAGALAVALLAGFAVFVRTVTFEPTAAPTLAAAGQSAADAVVVLTGGDGRIREGLHLFYSGTGRRLLISGVHPSTTRQELQRLAAPTPILFNCCVDVDYVARDTTGNATETRHWLDIWGFRRIVVVTSAYHMPRSLLEFRRALPGVELVAFPVVSHDFVKADWWRHPASAKRMLIEYAKCLPAAGRLLLSRLRGTPAPATLPAAPQSEVSSGPPPRITGL